MHISSKCPYCGHTSSYNSSLDGHDLGYLVARCDADTGGCDRPYTVKFVREIKVTSEPIPSIWKEYFNDSVAGVP